MNTKNVEQVTKLIAETSVLFNSICEVVDDKLDCVDSDIILGDIYNNISNIQDILAHCIVAEVSNNAKAIASETKGGAE